MIDDVTLNVSLAHYTVEQYLLGQDAPEATHFHIQLQDARIQVGQFCVTYLSFSDFETQVSQYCPGVETSTFKILETATRTPSLLSPNTPAMYAAKAIRKVRHGQHSSSNIDFARHLTMRKGGPSSVPLMNKYLFLSYVAENWLYHTRDFNFEVGEEESCPKHFLLLEALTFEKPLLFDFKPWEEIKSRNAQHIEPFGWGLFANHVPLIHAINRRTEYNVYLARATDAYIPSLYQRCLLTDSKFFPSEDLSFQNLMVSDDWKTWIYRNLTLGFRRKATGMTNIICLWGNHNVRLISSYLLFDSVRLGNLVAVKTLCTLSGWAMLDTPILAECEGFQCNPLEVAALRGFEEIMDLFRESGHTVSTSFNEWIKSQREIYHAIHSNHMSVVRCLVKAQSLEYSSGMVQTGTTPISYALDFLKMANAQQDCINPTN